MMALPVTADFASLSGMAAKRKYRNYLIRHRQFNFKRVGFLSIIVAAMSACSGWHNLSGSAKDPGILFVFEENGAFGFNDKDGKRVIAAKYSHTFTDTFDHKIAFVVDSEGPVVIDKNGKKVLSPYIYENGPDYIVEGLFRFVKNNKIGFADEDGSIIIAARYEFVTEFKEGLACFGDGFTLQQQGEIALMKGGRWGFINSKGDIVIAQKYDEMAYFEDGTASVKENGKHLVIDKLGNEVM